jgi:hypothetical protein
MKNVSGPQVVTPAEALESLLSPQIQEALGGLLGAAREGLLALSVGVGLSVVHELMEAEVTEIVGAQGKHNPQRTAKRHGHERGSMTLGGRRVEVSRPRMRTADDERELPVETYEYFADRDPLTWRGDESDARWGLDPRVRLGGRAGRRGGRAGSAVDVEVDRVGAVRRADAYGPGGADGPPAG